MNLSFARSTCAAAALSLLVPTVAALAAAPRRVAVLEFTASWSGQCTAPNRVGETAERCETLLLLTDEARGVPS